MRKLRQIRYRDPRFEAEYGYFPMRAIQRYTGIDRRVIWRACASTRSLGRNPKEFISDLKPVVDAIMDRKLVLVDNELVSCDLAGMRLYK